MENQKSSMGGGKLALIIVLAVANLIMLVLGIITIPKNFRKGAEAGASTPRPEQTLPLDEPELWYEDSLFLPESEDKIQGSEEASINLSTTERPDLGDFLWYLDGVLYTGVPEGAVTIDNLSSLMGDWKALIFYDPYGEYESSAYDFLNINIGGTADRLSLTLDWYLIFWSWESESYDLTDMEDSVFIGKWENGGLWASGPGTIHLDYFYSLGDKQYAIGTMDTPDGLPAVVALARP